jgi:hypothetical protein
MREDHVTAATFPAESGGGTNLQKVDESQTDAGSSRGRDAHAVGNVPDGGLRSIAYTVSVPVHPGASHNTGKMRYIDDIVGGGRRYLKTGAETKGIAKTQRYAAPRSPTDIFIWI